MAISKLYYLIVLTILITANPIRAQTLYNLVPNSSFELYDTCPDDYGQIYRAIGWTSRCESMVEYFNSCSPDAFFNVPSNYMGYQNARHGIGYTQIAIQIALLQVREYVGCQLLNPLKHDVNYCVEFSISLVNVCTITCD